MAMDAAKGNGFGCESHILRYGFEPWYGTRSEMSGRSTRLERTRTGSPFVVMTILFNWTYCTAVHRHPATLKAIWTVRKTTLNLIFDTAACTYLTVYYHRNFLLIFFSIY